MKILHFTELKFMRRTNESQYLVKETFKRITEQDNSYHLVRDLAGFNFLIKLRIDVRLLPSP